MAFLSEDLKFCGAFEYGEVFDEEIDHIAVRDQVPAHPIAEPKMGS